MGSYVNRGRESFTSAVNSKIYVDKTGLLEYTNSVLETEQRWICSSRPRRFGKSIAAGMITAYYDRTCDSKELFSKYEIAKTDDFEKYLNQFDVIQIDMADIRTELGSNDDIVKYISKKIILELKEYYPEYVTPEDSLLPTVLSNINLRTGAKFVIVIDEWDAIFRDDKYNEKSQREYIDLLRGLFKGERSKAFTKLAYITGILPIKKYNSESALNNFDEFTMTSPKMLSKYVGFTQDEVMTLCNKYDMDFDEAATWYDGYSFKRIAHIYNPNSVVKAMLSGEYDCYWSKTVAYESLKSYICMNFDGLKEAIVSMIGGGRCRVNTLTFENDMTSFKSRDDVITVLIHLGYLAYDQDRKEAYVPNEEVRMAFENTISSTDWTPVIDAINKSERLLKLTWAKESDEVAEYISEVHMQNTSILQYNDENSLSCVITLAYYNAINDYTVIRELPSGLGYADIVYLPKKHSDKPAMIVELKYNKNAKAAIEQIKEKKYPKSLQDYKGNLLLVGVNYDKDTKEHSCVIEDCELEY
jgi:ribosomal protein S8